MNIISEELVNNSKARELLEKLEKEKKELKYEQKNSLEILKKSVKLDITKSSELEIELKKIEKLRERQLIAIVNFLPEDKDDLRAILNKDYASLTNEEIESVLKTVKNYI